MKAQLATCWPHDREEYWRLVDSAGKFVTCTIEETPDGFEVRVSYGDTLIKRHLTRRVGRAWTISELTRLGLLDQGLVEIEVEP